MADDRQTPRRRRRPQAAPVSEEPVRIIVGTEEDTPDWMVSDTSGAASRRNKQKKTEPEAPRHTSRGAQETQAILQMKQTLDERAADAAKKPAAPRKAPARKKKASARPMSKKARERRARKLRRLTIGAIENDLETAFPDYSVRRGFTANIVIDHVNRRDGEKIDDIGESLDRAAANGVKNLVVQPTHLMNGLEYDELCGKIADYSDAFEKVVIGDPLLTTDEDFQTVADAIVDWTKDYDDGETAIVFMGHGTEAESNAVYQKMQDLLTSGGHTNYFVGTVEAAPSLDDVIAAVKAGEYKKVVLEPLMVVAGDHANNDMAGDEDDSWKSAFEKEGYEVTCLLRGLGENETIRQLYVAHAQAAVNAIAQ